MTRRPPRSTRTDTLFPYTTLFRSDARAGRRSEIPRPAAILINRCPQPWKPFCKPFANTFSPPRRPGPPFACAAAAARRSEEHTSELQSLMRISYAVFCLKKKKNNTILTGTIEEDHQYIHEYI